MAAPLNMAWHWRQLDVPFRLLTRIGTDHADVVRSTSSIATGSPTTATRSSGRRSGDSIDIEIQPDRPAVHGPLRRWGLGRTTALTPTRRRASRAPGRLHVVLVEGAITELERLARGRARSAEREVSADFLGFRHYTVERFARTMAARGPGVRRLAGRSGRSDGRRPRQRRAATWGVGSS